MSTCFSVDFHGGWSVRPGRGFDTYALSHSTEEGSSLYLPRDVWIVGFPIMSLVTLTSIGNIDLHPPKFLLRKTHNPPICNTDYLTKTYSHRPTYPGSSSSSSKITQKSPFLVLSFTNTKSPQANPPNIRHDATTTIRRTREKKEGGKRTTVRCAYLNNWRIPNVEVSRRRKAGRSSSSYSYFNSNPLRIIQTQPFPLSLLFVYPAAGGALHCTNPSRVSTAK